MMQTEFEAGLQRDGFTEILTRDMAPSPANGDHGHHFDVRGLVLAGEFVVTRDGQATAYRAGRMFEVARDVIHNEAVGPDGVKLLLGRRY